MPRIDPSEYEFVTDDYLAGSSEDELNSGLTRLRAISGPVVKDDPKAKAAVRSGIDRIYGELDARKKGTPRPAANPAPTPAPAPKPAPARPAPPPPAAKPVPPPAAKPVPPPAAPPPPRAVVADDDVEEVEDDSETFGEEGDVD